MAGWAARAYSEALPRARMGDSRKGRVVAVRRRWKLGPLLCAAVVATSVLAGPSSLGASRPPANDDRGDARVITAARGALTQSTVGATPQSGLGENTGLATVWFRWKATHTGWETFDSAGSQAHTSLIVYPPGTLTNGYLFWSRLFGRQDSELYSYNPYPGKYAVRYVRVRKDKTYLVTLWTSTAGANTVRLSWHPGGPPGRPENDDLAAARVLTGSSGSVVGTTSGSTYEPGESPLLDECASDCGHFTGDHGPSVWFRWTPPSDGTWRLDNRSRGAWAWIQVYRGGPSIGELNLVQERIGYPGSYPSTLLDVPLQGGRPYWIRYSSYSYHGPFALHWGPAADAPTPTPPANNDFADAVNLGGTPQGRVRATTQWATTEAGEPDSPGWTDVDSTVWFRWTAPASRLTTIGTPDHYTATRIWTGSSLSQLTAVPASHWGEPDRRPTFEAVQGTTYWIQMGGTDSHGGAFDLTWDQTVPANDNVGDAYVLWAGHSGASPDWGLVRSGVEPDEPADASGRPAEHTVWMRWTPNRSGAVSFLTVGDHVPALWVYTGGPAFTSMSRVAGGPHGADFVATAGTTYFLQLRAELASIGHVGWTQKWDYTRPTVDAALDDGAVRTRDTWVALRLQGSDTGSGLRGWLVSMVASGGEVLAAAWVPARGRTSRTVRWSVTHTAYGGTPAEGRKRVYVQAVDVQGNGSSIISRSITLRR